jgi:hypothetical protein
MRFWVLDPPDNQKLLAERTEDVVRLKTVICPANSGHQRAGRRIGQLSVDLPRDFERDFIWTWHSDCLLTKRAVNALKRNHVTGFETLPVTARFRQSLLDLPELFELRVTGWGGIAPLSSGIRLLEHCEHCGLLESSYFRVFRGQPSAFCFFASIRTPTLSTFGVRPAQPPQKLCARTKCQFRDTAELGTGQISEFIGSVCALMR